MKELLRELTALPGTCGFESDVAKYLYKRVKKTADEAYIDGLGNLIAMKQGGRPGPTLMLSAHIDEVGFMVKKIEPSGLLRFEKLGGHDDRVCYQSMWWSTRNKARATAWWARSLATC